MTRTELITNLIKNHLDNNNFVTVDTFRDMFINGLPGRLALLAISRDGKNVLPVFDVVNYTTTTTDTIDYKVIRDLLGTDWIPVLNAHIRTNLETIPQTLLTTDGIVGEDVLTRIFGNRFNWTQNLLTINAFSFGDFDVNTLPRLMAYTIDRVGARRLKIGADVDEGRVFGLHLDTNGYIRYLDRTNGTTMFARMEIGLDTLVWNTFPIKD
jgi:hypothetical protein